MSWTLELFHLDSETLVSLCYSGDVRSVMLVLWRQCFCPSSVTLADYLELLSRCRVNVAPSAAFLTGHCVCLCFSHLRSSDQVPDSICRNAAIILRWSPSMLQSPVCALSSSPLLNKLLSAADRLFQNTSFCFHVRGLTFWSKVFFDDRVCPDFSRQYIL